MADLPVNFKDDILAASMGGKRRYKLIQNADGTVYLEDTTTYTQVGSSFGAAQINATNGAVNALAANLAGLNFQVVTELPEDAASHPNTVYIVTEE